MNETNVGNHKSRRPTRAEQIEIQRVIQLHYNRGLSIEDIHRITGYNSKTISKYYNKWSDEIEKSETQNLIEREKSERRRVILCYSHLLCEAYQILDSIKKETEQYDKENKPVPQHLRSKNIEIIRTISTLNEKIGSFIMQQTLNEVLDKMIEDRLKKNAERLKKNDESNSEK